MVLAPLRPVSAVSTDVKMPRVIDLCGGFWERYYRSGSPGVLAVRRSGSWLGGALRIAVYVNEKKIGELGPSGTLTCRMDPGPIRLRVRAMELRGGGSISGKTYADLDDALRSDQRKSYECGLQSPFRSSGIYIKSDQPVDVWPVRDGTSNTSNPK